MGEADAIEPITGSLARETRCLAASTVAPASSNFLARKEDVLGPYLSSRSDTSGIFVLPLVAIASYRQLLSRQSGKPARVGKPRPHVTLLYL